MDSETSALPRFAEHKCFLNETWRVITCAKLSVDDEGRDVHYVGSMGTMTISSRGKDGAGEVSVLINSARQSLIAWSTEPIKEGVDVLVIDDLAPQTVLVEPINNHFHTNI